MKTTHIAVYGYELHYRHSHYVMSGSQHVTALASTVVRLTADNGLVGRGEVCPLDPRYLPASAGGARVALRELAPALLDADLRELHMVRGRLDHAMSGHDYAKSALDIARWDSWAKPPVALLRRSLAGASRSGSLPTRPCRSLGRTIWRPWSESAKPPACTVSSSRLERIPMRMPIASAGSSR